MKKIGKLAGVLACAAMLLCAYTDGTQKADKDGRGSPAQVIEKAGLENSSVFFLKGRAKHSKAHG